jgi:hypothetical protein
MTLQNFATKRGFFDNTLAANSAKKAADATNDTD